MRHYPIILCTLIVTLLPHCSNNKSHSSSNSIDSLQGQTALQTNTDTARQPADSNVLEQTMASSALAQAGAGSNLPVDSNSFVHMKDSIQGMLKDKLGKSAGMVDSMMSAMSKLSTSSSGSTGTPGSSSSKKSVPYHEPLEADYVIPVSGNGPGFNYEYVGGSVFNDKKSGLSFTMLVDPAKAAGWNVYFDGYAQVQQFGINTHYSFLLNNSFTHIVLNNDHKVYTTQKAEQTIRQKNYSVTNIAVTMVGMEKLHGFNCVHAKVTAVTHFMGQTQDNEFDIWRSEDVPGAMFLESSIAVLASPFTLSMEEQLVKMGCKGAIVKIEFNEKSSVVRKELFAITKQAVDDSVFNIPPGYKEDKNTSLYSLMQ